MKVILFDLFGVLCNPTYSPTITQLVTDTKQRSRLLSRLTDLDLGDLSEKDFIADIASTASVDSEEVTELAKSFIKVNVEMITLARELKQRYKIGLLSNAPRGIVERCLLGDLDMFDNVYISSDLKMVKPNADIFNFVIDDLSIEPQQVLFIDDRQENIDAATKLGMSGHVFTGIEPLKRELDKPT